VRVDYLMFYVTLVSLFGFATTSLVKSIENRLFHPNPRRVVGKDENLILLTGRGDLHIAATCHEKRNEKENNESRCRFHVNLQRLITP